MTELKIRKIGNSQGVLLPREVIQRLNLADGASLFLNYQPDGSIVLSPYDPDFAEQMEAAEVVAGQYRNALRELAK